MKNGLSEKLAQRKNGAVKNWRGEKWRSEKWRSEKWHSDMAFCVAFA
jgi:hypothetical protein